MKRKAQIELVNMDLPGVMDRMHTYAVLTLKDVTTKDLQGYEPMDFVMDVITKTCDGTRDWLNASTDDMEKFLFGCLKSDIHSLKKGIARRKAKGIHLMELQTNDQTQEDIKMANPTTPLVDPNVRPTGCDNLKDKEQYYTDILS